MSHTLPAAIMEEAEPLVRVLKRAGYRATASFYSPASFGNWYLDCKGPAGMLRVVKDKGYFSVEGERSVLEGAGLWLFATQSLSELTAKVSADLRGSDAVKSPSEGLAL